MNRNLCKVFAVAIFAMFVSVGSQAQKAKVNEGQLVKEYNSAVLNSSYTAQSKVYNHLFAVNSSNRALSTKMINGVQYVLAVSLKSSAKYYPTKSDSLWCTGPWDLWVTMAPALREKVKGVDSNKIDLRLKQLLGLPPGSSYSYFVEFWVQPKDIFRPCPDKEITDSCCGLCFPPNADSAHIAWINAQRLSRFFVCDTAARYPWTELGYTYDWAPSNPHHVGCSEYVIKQNSNVYVNRIYTINEYLYRKGK